MKHFLNSKLKFILNHKKIFIPVFLVLLFLIWSIFLHKPQTNNITYTQVLRGDIKETVSAAGTLDGKDSADLKFPIEGKLNNINVKQGDTVKKGQVLASLDTVTLTASLQQAENNLSTNQAALDEVLDSIHDYQYGNGGFANVGSANETFTQRQDRTAAQEAVNNSVDSIKAAQRALDDSILTSPLDGIVTEVNSVNGQNIAPTDIVVQVVDQSQVYFDAQVDESDIGKVSLGQDAVVTLNSYGNQTFPGKVEQITPVTETTSSGATVVVVKINLGNPQINFATGLNGQADITINESKNTLTLPQETLKDDTNVIIKTGTGFKEVPVTTGLQSDTDFEVKSGVTDGQTVVTNPEVVNLNPSPSLLNSIGKIFGKN